MINEEKREIAENNEEESFAELFERSYKQANRLAPGEKTEVRVLKISGEWIFLDTGRKGEGILDKKELLDESGNLTVREGDVMSA